MARKKICGIYCILNKKSGKRYIGQSIDIHARWNKHQCDLKNNRHYNKYLQYAWNADHERSFYFYIVEECEPANLNEKEIYWMDYYNVLNKSYGYNLAEGGGNYNQKIKELINPIDVYDLSGNYIKTYDNFNNAEDELNINRHYISEVCHGKQQTTCGYVFRFSKHPFDEYPITSLTSVDQYNRNWEFIMSYDSVKDASKKTGVFQNHIRDVINGKRKTAGNYYWLKRGINPPENKESMKCEALWKPVNQYDKDWNFIASYASISQASRKLNILVTSICAVLYGKNKTAGGFNWLSPDSQPPANAWKVDQYDYDYNYIGSYRSISEAARETGINVSTISGTLTKKYKSAGGYYWFKHGEQPQKIDRARTVCVDQYDLNWKYISTYTSIREAYKKTGTDHRTISNVLAGKYKTAGGFHWLRHGEKPPVINE